MEVRRIVTNLTVDNPREATKFYEDFLGLEVVMDHGWIATVARPGELTTQLGLMSRDLTAPVNPNVSIEVDDVDTAYDAAQAANLEIVHPLSNEDWGVRRFFFRDGDGNVINVLSHR